MPYYTAKEKIDYYKNLLKQSEKQCAELERQVDFWMKTSNQLSFEITILKNKYERKTDDQ